jgi:SAM-dependent methyltransferase
VRRCPACGGALVAWRTVVASEPGSAELYPLLHCATCGTARTDAPAPPDAHDTGAYGGGAPRLERVAAPLLAAFDRRRLALLRRAVPPPARLLDAGAGRGRFVLAAARAGYAASGIEPSARGADAAAARGAAVRRVAIERAGVEPGSLDVVTLWHVLEHVEDPAAVVARLAEWLRPGGALLVGAPNVRSLQARLGGDRWYHWDVPRHRTHFSPDGLRRLLAAHGLEPVRTTHVLLEHNPFGMWQSLVSRATREPSYLYHLLKRNTSPRSRDLAITALALPLAPAAAALESAAGIARRGGTIAVLARRV